MKLKLNFNIIKCVSDSSLGLVLPSRETLGIFKDIFKIQDKISVVWSVGEVVNLVQTVLVHFGILDSFKITGLLCSLTEESLVQGWDIYGSVYYKINIINNGVLTPILVACLLGFYLRFIKYLKYFFHRQNNRNRLELYSAIDFSVLLSSYQKKFHLPLMPNLDPASTRKLMEMGMIYKPGNSIKMIFSRKTNKLSSNDSIQFPYSDLSELSQSSFKDLSFRTARLWSGAGATTSESANIVKKLF